MRRVDERKGIIASEKRVSKVREHNCIYIYIYMFVESISGPEVILREGFSFLSCALNRALNHRPSKNFEDKTGQNHVSPP